MRFLVVLSLLILPTLAVLRTGLEPLWVAGYAVLINFLTYVLYAVDKVNARGGAWRIPEAWLHIFELAGGWPGAFLAQRSIRHKCSKGSYQVMFWLIVLLWQFAALDYLQNWGLVRSHWSTVTGH